MNALMADGTIVAMLAAWLEDLSFWDYVMIIATLAAYILAALSTGGATTVVKFGLAIAHLIAIASKFQMLEDL